MLSSTQIIPKAMNTPRHIAIIMDGNGRWATRCMLPRTMGHRKGVQTARKIAQACVHHEVEYLTLFAFSSENWRRPAEEVGLLMNLFAKALECEISTLEKQGVHLRIIGDLSPFEPRLRQLIHQAEVSTQHNTRLHMTIAANYGGRWDILQAMRLMLASNPTLAFQPETISESALDVCLSMSWAPEPDLFIRTGGEQRISNFLIWQLAYTELYFTDCFWPEFGETELLEAIAWFAGRERRFGRTSEQLKLTVQNASSIGCA